MACDTVHIVALMVCALCSVLGAHAQNSTSDPRSVNDGFWNIPIAILKSCSREDIVVCLGTKAVSALDRASRMASVQIVEGVQLIQNEEVSRRERSFTDVEIQKSIDASPEGRSSRIIELAANSIDRFLRTHSLRFQLPSAVQRKLQNAVEGGRPFGVAGDALEALLALKKWKKLKKLKKLIPLIAGAAIFLVLVQGLMTAGMIKLAVKTFIIAKFVLKSIVLIPLLQFVFSLPLSEDFLRNVLPELEQNSQNSFQDDFNRNLQNTDFQSFDTSGFNRKSDIGNQLAYQAYTSNTSR